MSSRKSQKPVAKLLGHDHSVRAIVFPADGKTLISSGADGVIRWDLSTGKELRRYRRALLAISPNGKTLALGSETIHLVDGASGAEMRRWRSPRAQNCPWRFPPGATGWLPAIPGRGGA